MKAICQHKPVLRWPRCWKKQKRALKEYYKCVQIPEGKYSHNELKYKAFMHRNYIYKSKKTSENYRIEKHSEEKNSLNGLNSSI